MVGQWFGSTGDRGKQDSNGKEHWKEQILQKNYHQPETRGTSEDTDNKRQGIKKPNAASMASLDRSIDHWAGFQHFPVLL